MGSVVAPMSPGARKDAYLKQTGRKMLTARQQRRVMKKAGRMFQVAGLQVPTNG
jgi:hypothetical protein